MTQPFPLGSGCTYEPHVPATFRSVPPPVRAQMRRFVSYAPGNGGFPKPQAGGSSPLGGTSLSNILGLGNALRNLGLKVHREPLTPSVPAPFAVGGAA